LVKRISLALFLLPIVISAGLLGNVIPEVKAWELLQHVICKNVKGTDYATREPVDATTKFSVADESVCLFCWFRVTEVSEFATFRLITKWYDPDGNIHKKDESELKGGYWKSWRNISIKGQMLKKGKWAVEMSLDGGPFRNEVLFKDFFTIGVRTLKIHLVGVPTSVSANVLVDGKSAGTILGAEEKSFELFEEELHTIAVDEYVLGTAGIRYHCSTNTWILTGIGLTEWRDFTYETEYQLTVNSPYGGVIGTGWYKKDSTASFSVSPTAPLEGFLGMLGGKRVFQKWTGDSSATSPSATIVMDAPHQVTALWQEDIMMPMIIIVATMVGVGLVALAVMTARRRKRKETAPIASTLTATPVIPTPPPTTIQAEVPPVGEATEKYCMICGQKLPTTAGYCEKCGAKQSS